MDRQYFAGSASPFAWQAGRIQNHCAGLEKVVVVYVTYVYSFSFLLLYLFKKQESMLGSKPEVHGQDFQYR
jgi:hypothetical protein